MRTQGVDADAVLTEIGLDQALLEGGYSRYSQAQVSQLWKRAIELTGDPNFGFEVAAEVRPATFHVLGYSMSCSATLCRALERFAFYRSEEHTSELQSLMRISYAVFCLKKKIKTRECINSKQKQS